MSYSKKDMKKIVSGFTSRGVFYKPRFTDDWQIETREEKGRFYVYLLSRKLDINFKYGDAGKFYHRELMSQKLQVKSNANMFSWIKGEYTLTSEGLMTRGTYQNIFNRLFNLENPKFTYIKGKAGKCYQDSFGRYIYIVSVNEYQCGIYEEEGFTRRNCSLTNSHVVIDFTIDNDIEVKALNKEIYPDFIKEIKLDDRLLRIIMINISNMLRTNIIIDINDSKNNRLVMEKGIHSPFREHILKVDDNFYYTTDFFRKNKDKKVKTITVSDYGSYSSFKIEDIDKFIKNPFKYEFNTSEEYILSTTLEHWKVIPA